MTKEKGCLLCLPSKYPLIWSNSDFRVVLINDHSYPGYCRVDSVIHVKEMTDLSDSKRHEFMRIVFIIESVLRSHLIPEKINLASLGNITPHLHWHIIPRYKLDNHFPESIWANPKRAEKKELSESESLILIALIQKKLSN
ncbi:MAG: HIT family protein [Methylophilaceae bacterium]|jgi:diadenosine tetraphosphate (Ap4A) HIT family hydrolase|nr:HIT family protein [Methylophilaceae bacterium]